MKAGPRVGFPPYRSLSCATRQVPFRLAHRGQPRNWSRRAARWRAALSTSAFALSLAAGPALAQEQAQAQAQAQGFELSLDAVVNGTRFGAIDATVTLENDVSIAAELLIERLGVRLSPALREAARAAAVDGYLNLAALEALGIDVSFNPASLQLSLDIPLSDQDARSLYASAQHSFIRPDDAILPAQTSASLTIAGSRTVFYDEPVKGFGPLRVLGAFAANAFGQDGVYLFSDFIYDESAGERVTRGNTLLLHDDQPRAIRYSAGDVAPAIAAFQAAPLIGGLAVERAYSALQPARNVRPNGYFQFQLDRPATVEVLVNGTVLQTLRLDAGRYDLRDFPFLNGLNVVELYTTDQFGRQLLTTFSQFFSAQLLNPGISEFAATIGFEQFRNADGILTYDTDRPLATAFWRRGVSDALTFGANFQVDAATQMIGAEFAWASGFGTIVGAFASSRHDQKGKGAQMLVGYELTGRHWGMFRLPQFNAEYRHTTRDFSTLSNIGDNPYRHEVRARFAAGIPGDIFVGLSGSYLMRGDTQRDTVQYGTTMSKRLFGINFTGAYEYIDSPLFRDDHRVLLTASISLGSRSSARASFDSRRSAAQLEYNRFEFDELGDYGINARLGVDADRLTAAGGLRYNANRFEFAVEHDAVRPTISGGALLQQTTISAATQIAVADGELAFGRPVGPSFAIVSTHPTLGDSAAEVRQGLGRRDPQARSGLFGPALAPTGSAYNIENIFVGVRDLPPGYDVGAGRYPIFAGAASGYHFRIGSDASYTVLGVLQDSEGEPLSLKVGTAHALADTDFEPVQLFTNRTGRFVVEGLPPGEYELRMGSGDQMRFTFTVADGDERLLDVGRLRPSGQRKAL